MTYVDGRSYWDFLGYPPPRRNSISYPPLERYPLPIYARC